LVTLPEQPFTDDAIVADVMLREPKTLPGDASVSEVRAVLENPKVQMVLLADGTTFRGAVTELPPDASPSAPAIDFADPSPDTIAPTESAAAGYALTATNPQLRVIVLDEDGSLAGLLCLNATRTHFCGGAQAR
jgi:hypothetical protein